MSRRLNSACATARSEHLRGFFVGRSLAESAVLLCEAKIGGGSLVSRCAVAVLIDFAMEFPSLKHDWTFNVFRRAGGPTRMFQHGHFLYNGQETFFSS